MKLATPRWRTPIVVAVLLLLAGLMAPTALAVPPSAEASITPSPSAAKAGATQDFTFSLRPTSGRIGSFNLGAPAGWSISPTGDWSTPPSAGITRPTATQIQGRNLDISASSPLSLTFEAQAPCSPANGTWSVVARSGGGLTGSTFTVNPQPTTTLDGSCLAAFVTGGAPADAALNGQTKSQNITSDPYSPLGDPIQVEVLDAATPRQPRAGIEITLSLLCTPPHSTCASPAGGASLTGPVTATSGAGGIATFNPSFDGSPPPDPISIDKIGQGYKLKPEGAGVVGTAQPDAFGVYQEGEACTSSPCEVHGHSANNRLTTTVTAPPNGSLGVLVTSDPNVVNEVSCAGFTSPFTTQAVVVWKYTGDGSQTIVLDISKAMMREVLDRGSDHLDFCLDSEGKPFTDKFGVEHPSGNNTDGLLSDCNTGIDPNNCIVSQTAFGGGGRRMTVIVADGKGRP